VDALDRQPAKVEILEIGVHGRDPVAGDRAVA
jgi:hypothetical protein